MTNDYDGENPMQRWERREKMVDYVAGALVGILFGLLFGAAYIATLIWGRM